MNVYIFQAALLCEGCGEATRNQLRESTIQLHPGFVESDEYTYDSDYFPKGPYGDGGGEADSPQHCDHCQVFLGNSLTTDGVAYVREQLNEVEDTSGFDCPLDWHEFSKRLATDHPVLAIWAEELAWYGLNPE